MRTRAAGRSIEFANSHRDDKICHKVTGCAATWRQKTTQLCYFVLRNAAQIPVISIDYEHTSDVGTALARLASPAQPLFKTKFLVFI
jgi:hypothetical protein